MIENRPMPKNVLDLMPSLVEKVVTNKEIKESFNNFFSPFVYKSFGVLSRGEVLEKIALFILDPNVDVEKDYYKFIIDNILHHVPEENNMRAGFIGKMREFIKKAKQEWDK